jgi:hypothetical protein
MEEIMAKYRSAAREKVLERAKARKNQVPGGRTLTFQHLPEGMKAEFFKVTKSVHNLDILGYVITDPKHPDCDESLKPGYLWHSRRYFLHRNVGADENSYICPARTWGKPCPICEYAKQRKNSGEASKEELDALRPKERQLFNVIDLDSDPKKILLWDVSYFLFGDKLDKELADSSEDDVFGFFEPTEGLSLRVRFEKKSFNKNEFWQTDRIDFRERKRPYKESIIDTVFPLDDLLVALTYEQLEAIFVMGSEEEVEQAHKEVREAEEVRRPRRDRVEEDEEEEARPPRKKRQPEPEEDDEEDDTPPPPKRGRRVKPEPEPEEEEDDEEEEETPPKKRKDDSKCPQGLTFGADCDSNDECDSCKVWGACNAASRKLG